MTAALETTFNDAEIQAFFDNVLQAFHAVLNEISSTFGSLLDIIQAASNAPTFATFALSRRTSYKSLLHS